MWRHLKFNEAAPIELIRWQLAEKFGWTLDYIDALPMSDLHEYIQIMDARVKATMKGEKVA